MQCTVNWQYPAAAGGAGRTSITGGPGLDPELNLELQLAAGVELRFGAVGLYTEIKALYNNSDGGLGTPLINRYDPSASGVFGGVSFVF